MPFQPINFASIPAQKSAFADLPDIIRQAQLLREQQRMDQANIENMRAQRAAQQQQLEQEARLAPFREQLLRAQAQSQMTSADLAKDKLARMQMLRQFLQGNPAEEQDGATDKQQIADSQQARGQYSPGGSSQQSIASGAPMPSGISRLDQAALNPMLAPLLAEMGIKTQLEHTFSPETGQYMTAQRLPSGRVISTAQNIGKSPEQVALEKGIGGSKADTYKEMQSNISSMNAQNSDLDYIIDTLQKNPDAKNAIGPVNNILTKYFGNKEDQQLLGSIMSASGNIALSAAKNLKGAFTGRDQSLINSIKPNPKDTYNVFVGKLLAMRKLNELASQRLDRASAYMEKGMSQGEALKRASSDVPFDSIRENYGNLLSSSGREPVRSRVKIPTFTSEKEKESWIKGLSHEDYNAVSNQLIERMGG